MLSRVAESLYWTGRYVERAEDTSRLLHVNFHALLDGDLPDHGRAWRELLLMLGKDELFREHYDDYAARSVAEFLLWHAANPDAATACIARARENARSVREQLSTELWEHLNRMHLLLSSWRPAGMLAGPHDFFVQVRQGSHALQGVIAATLPRGEAHEFLELGLHLERADAAARVLHAKAPQLALAAPTQETAARVSELLKACGGFEACRKQEHGELRPEQAIDFLLRDRRFPRTVLFCLERSLAAIREISGSFERPQRAIGRVSAELAFADLSELDASSLGRLLTRVLRGIEEAGDEIASAYFTTQVVLPGPYAHQQQQ